MRYIHDRVLRDLDKHMVLISGPRQCGKTTFARALIPKIDTQRAEYLNWDQIRDRARIAAQNWSEDARLVIFDEIHKKKGWKTFLKGIYDTKPKDLALLVTGSARLELFQKAGDSMFGRFRAWRMHPFCLAEDPLKLPLEERMQRLLERGGFPFPYLEKSPDEAARWRNQRWSLLLREDVRDLETIKDIQKLELLAELLKSRAGGMLSYANLAEDTEVGPKTAKMWTDVLERLYLIFRVTPYSRSLKRSLSKTPKVYFVDPGDLAEQSPGVRLENLVAVQLLKRLHYLEDAFGDRLELHYVRDKEEREVDFLITLAHRPVALIEVKLTAQEPDPSLLYFKKQLGLDVAIQLHAQGRQRAVRDGVRLLSVQEFLSQPLETRAFWKAAK